jgi:hypothetical protein
MQFVKFSNSTERKKAKGMVRGMTKKSSDCLRRALNRIKGGMYMKMKTRIISLSILAILTVSLLTFTAASATTQTAAPKLVGNTLLIHASQTYVNSGDTVYFSGYLTETNGYGIGGQYGTLIDNGQQMWSFHTASDGSWGPLPITFNGAGTRYVAVNCAGQQVGLVIHVY